jgi:hypothetical protein
MMRKKNSKGTKRRLRKNKDDDEDNFGTDIGGKDNTIVDDDLLGEIYL